MQRTDTHTQSYSAYGNVARVYDAFLTMSGFKRGVEHFLRRVPFNLPANARILDAGCGTGLVAFHMAERFPRAQIVATDIDAKMLRAMDEIRKVGRYENIVIAQGDLRTPERLYPLGMRQMIPVPENYFDAICVSGALEHVPLGETVSRLAKLLKAGGIFFNLGMRRSPAGAVLGMMYRVRPYTIGEMRRACEYAGLEAIRVLRLSVEDFPANLSRVAIIARRRNELLHRDVR